MKGIKRKKLVLCCTHSFGAKFLEGQLEFMKDNGFDVYVFSGPGEEIKSLCRREQATLIVTPFKREISLSDDFKCLFFIIKKLKVLRPEIINAGTPKAALLMCLAAKIIGHKRTIFTLRGLRSDTLIGVKKRIVKLMEILTCRLADCVLPISPSLMKHAVEENIVQAGKARVLGSGSSNGIDVAKFTRSVDTSNARISVRKELGILENDFVVSYIGRFNNDKGVPELFETFKKLIDVHPDSVLLLVGRFEDEDAISNNVRDEMINHPKVIIEEYRQEIKPIYEAIDLLVLFSKREGFGNILIEASCMGVPVIARKIPGCSDAVNHGYSGFLVGDQDELLEKMEYYVSDRAIASQHGRQGEEWVRRNFENKKIWFEQLELYQSFLR